MTTTCTGCGDYQSGDPSGQCWECRTAQPGYLAQLRQTVETGMAAEYAAHPEWQEAAQARQAEGETRGPSPFRFFHADVIRKECPECGWATAAGFDSPHDPGAENREPTSCTGCAAREIEAGLRAEAEARNTYEAPEVPEPAQPEHDQPEMELSA